MAIIYSYPTVTPTSDDLVLGTDVNGEGKPTKNFTIQSIVDIVQGGATGLGAVLTISSDALQQPATNFTNVQGTGTSTFGSFTDGTMTISSGVGTGFTAFTSTAITGTLQTAAQPNITSLGNLTGLVINGAISGTNVITSTTLVGASNTNIASTLAIKTYVDSNPSGAESLAATLLIGNITNGRDIVVSAGDDITFTNTSKILMGTTATDNLEIYSDSTNSIVIDRSPGALKLQTSLLSVRNEADTTQTISASAAGAVELYHGGTKKFETTSSGVKTDGIVENPAGTSGAPTFTFTGDTTTGMYRSGAGFVAFSSNGNITARISESDFESESTDFTVNGVFRAFSTAQASFGGKLTVATPTASSDAATKGYVDSNNAGQTLEYAGDATGPFALNLVDDDLEFNGDSNITVTAAAVAATKGIVTIDLNNDVGISGTMTAGTFTDGNFIGISGTYTGYQSITSAAFVGPLTGNATTATALASPGTIQLLSGSGATQGVASNAVTYTDGGNIQLTTTLADTTVTAKALTNLPTPTSSAIAASDTILAAMAKLQGQITGIAGSLAFEGTWDARTVAEGGAGTPPSATPVNGQFWIVDPAGSQNLDGITDWLVGDWAIYVSNGAGTDAWQKLDQSNEVLGSGAANKIAKWTSANTLATGLISDDGTTVTIGTNGNLTVQGDTILGDSATDDTITLNGPTTFESTGRFKQGLALGTATDGSEYGATGQVLTASTSAGSPPTWETPTTGTVTSVTGGTGITITGTATATPTVNIDTVGTDNAIAVLTAATPVATDTLWFNDIDDSNTIRKATIADIVDLGNETLSQVLSNGNQTGSTNIVVQKSIQLPLTTTNNNTPTDQGVISFGGTYTNGNRIYNHASGGTLRVEGSSNLQLYAPNISLSNSNGSLIIAGDTSTSLHQANSGEKLKTTTTGIEVFGNIILEEGEIKVTNVGGEGKITMGDYPTTTSKVWGLASSVSAASEFGVFQSNAAGGNPFSAGAAKMLFDSSGNATFTEKVGIGSLATTPTRNLSVTDRINIVSATNATANLLFGDTADDDRGQIRYNNVDDSMDIKVDDAVSLTINNTGLIVNRGSSNNFVAIGASALPAWQTSPEYHGVQIGSNNTIWSRASELMINNWVNLYIDSSDDERFIADGKAVTANFGSDSISFNQTESDGVAGALLSSVTGGLRTLLIMDTTDGAKFGSNAFDVDVEITGDLTVDGHIIHGGKGGTFTGSAALTDGVQGNLFTLTRANTGTLMFDVWLTSGDNTTESICKRFTVARSYGVVSPPFNKLIDTGPVSSNDFAVSFVGDSTTGVICKVTPSGTNQTISYTVMVGFDSVNTLTVS